MIGPLARNLPGSGWMSEFGLVAEVGALVVESLDDVGLVAEVGSLGKVGLAAEVGDSWGQTCC